MQVYAFYKATAQYARAVAYLHRALTDPHWRPRGVSKLRKHGEEEGEEEEGRGRAALCEDAAELAVHLSVDTRAEGGDNASALHDVDDAAGVVVDFRAFIGDALKETAVNRGKLWTALAAYHVSRNEHSHAVDTFEFALGTALSTDEFSVVFDAYAGYEEERLATIAAAFNNENENDNNNGEKQHGQLDSAMQRVESLLARRPMLLSNVVLRTYPHHVHEWHKRARMYKKNADAVNVVDTYTKAVQIVDPWKAVGKVQTLWLAFARYYEEAGELDSAVKVFERATHDPEYFKTVAERADIWCEYAEHFLRRGDIAKAVEVLRRATQEPDAEKRRQVSDLKAQQQQQQQQQQASQEVLSVVGEGRRSDQVLKYEYDNSSPAWDSYKSSRIWRFLIDLVHSTADVDDVVQLHEQCLKMNVASVETVVAGATFLSDRRLFELAFRLYDKAVGHIAWPDALTLWIIYLDAFVQRYGSTKLERARDLFEEAIRCAPTSKRGGVLLPHESLSLLYVKYAEMEARHSLCRRSIAVLSRAVAHVRVEDRADMYRLLIVRVASTFGASHTRLMYERALVNLPRAEDVLDFGIRYAALELRLGEIDRARRVFSQLGMLADPRRKGVFERFWSEWQRMEVKFGSEESMAELLRAKKGANVKFQSEPLESKYRIGDDNDAKKKETDGADGEEEKISDDSEDNENSVHLDTNANIVSNAEEIELDMSDEDDDDEEDDDDGFVILSNGKQADEQGVSEQPRKKPRLLEKDGDVSKQNAVDTSSALQRLLMKARAHEE